MKVLILRLFQLFLNINCKYLIFNEIKICKNINTPLDFASLPLYICRVKTNGGSRPENLTNQCTLYAQIITHLINRTADQIIILNLLIDDDTAS